MVFDLSLRGLKSRDMKTLYWGSVHFHSDWFMGTK